MKTLVLFFILATLMLSSSVLADMGCTKDWHCPKPLVCNSGICWGSKDVPHEPWNDHGFIRSFSSQSSSGAKCTDKSDCPDRYVCWHDHKCHSVIEVMEGVTPEPDYGEGPNPEW